MSNGPQKRPSLQVIHESVLPTNVVNFEQHVEYDGLVLNRSKLLHDLSAPFQKSKKRFRIDEDI